MSSYKEFLGNLPFTRLDRMLVPDRNTFRTTSKMLQSFEKREKVDDINTGKERRKDSNPLGRDTDPRGI